MDRDAYAISAFYGEETRDAESVQEPVIPERLNAITGALEGAPTWQQKEELEIMHEILEGMEATGFDCSPGSFVVVMPELWRN